MSSAPAGFGKTTLVSEWVAGPRDCPPKLVCGNLVAWLSLDEADNDPARFITYLVAALQTIKPGIGESLLPALQGSQPLQIEAVLTALLNEVSRIPEHFVLILDDYHSIDSRPVDKSLDFLVEHQPPQMHLVITTREDPQLPLARYRARGQLTELRAADLRFTPGEAADGSVAGFCLFSDGSECDEWAYFRGECKIGDSLKTPEVVVTPGSALQPGTEAVTDWWGTIKNTPAGGQYKDFFERQDLGQVISYGIDSIDPAIQSQIEALRDTGKIVHLYGIILMDAPDYNGSQIQPDRIVVE